jgi:integrase
LDCAPREELVTRNVAALVRVPVPRGRKAEVWLVDEARRFLESARADGNPLYAGYVLMFVLGLRRGELLRRPTKTKTSEAPLPLPDICARALEQRRLVEARWRLAAGAAWAGTGLVLTTRLGDALDPRNFHRYFKARVEEAGVPVISVHSTRRICASLLVALDVHPRVAIAILRHSQIAVTMGIYSQVSSASTRKR